MPKIILVPCVNSHRFERREIEIYEEVKVGRSVARCKTSPDNAIFDCKVLSRSHAVMWYQDGAIWIKDTSSSNGTFINSTRLSRGGEESEPFKIQSGDKIQFGVDVTEQKKKDGANPVTHGCIIAKATVVIPDVLIPNPNYVINNPLLNSKSMSASSETLNNYDEDQDIIELHAAIKNAVNRENLLHTRLQELEARLGTAIEAAELGWQALIKEDKLLARIELLENQLEIFTRNPAEQQMTILKLENEKHDYQIHAKDSLRAICLEKSDVSRKCSDLENLLTTARMEVGHYNNLHLTVQDELVKTQDELRKKVLELETKESEHKTATEAAASEHQEALGEVTKSLEDLQNVNTEVAEQRDALETQLDDITAEHNKEIVLLQEHIESLKDELLSSEDQKLRLTEVSEENTILKNENYRLEEELIKLREEAELVTLPKEAVVQCEEQVGERVAVETETVLQNTRVERHYSDASTNTDVREKEALLSEGDQENQMNTVNIRDSMSQTEKWFDAISPSSSKSDIFSNSFTAGDKRYRSMRPSARREPPRPWSNSNAFEGSIAHAMALIESLDDIKSSCVRFREENQTSREDMDLSVGSGEEASISEEASVSEKQEAAISPPPKRRNSYREACEEDETANTLTLRPSLEDDASEADEQYELAPEDAPPGERSSAILNKVESVTSSPRPESTGDGPGIQRTGSMKSRFKGIAGYVSSFWGTGAGGAR